MNCNLSHSNHSSAFVRLRQAINADDFRQAFIQLSDHEMQSLATMVDTGDLSALERHWLFCLIEEFQGFLENHWTLSQQGDIHPAYSNYPRKCLSC